MSASGKAALAARLISAEAAVALSASRVGAGGKYAVSAPSHVLAELQRYGLISRGRSLQINKFGLQVRDALKEGAHR